MNEVYGGSKNKTIVLIYPKLEKDNPARIHYFPLPVLAVAGPLLRNGYDVTIFDRRVQGNFDNFLGSLKQKPLFFGLSVIIGYPVLDGLNVSRRIKEEFPDVPVVWGGWFPTLEPEVTLKENSIDLVTRGPGERTIVKLARCLEQKGDISQIKGIAYRDKEAVVVNSPAPPEDQDRHNRFPYHILDAEKYNCIQQKEINYITSYGCPFDCTFCCVAHLYRRRWLPLSSEKVVEEISHLVHEYGISHVEFQDDNFFTNRKRAKEILKGILARGLNITWTAQARFDNLIKFDAELLNIIKESGCKKLYASGESGSEKILKVIRKRITIDHILTGVELLERHNIPLRTTFMVGLPRETLQDLKMTLDLSKRLMEMKSDIEIYYSFYRPVPATELFQEAVNEGIIQHPKSLEEWAQYAPIDQKQFWLFLKEDTTKLRNEMKKLCFYFWFAHYRPFLKKVEGTGLGILLKIVKPAFRIRYEHIVLNFPIAWGLFGLVHRWRPSLFYKTGNADLKTISMSKKIRRFPQ